MTHPPESLVSDEIAAFLAQGISILVGSCAADGMPECMRAVGLRLAPDRRHLTVYLPELTSGRTVQNVRDNPRVAVFVSYPLDHRSYQLKGAALRLAPAEPQARAHIEGYLATFASVLEVIGMPSEVVHMVTHWPSLALELRLDSLFVQTPGPGAGAALSGRAS